MAKSVHLLHSVGDFFGVTESASENLEKWKIKAKKKMKDKEFGLSIKKSLGSHVGSQDKFIQDAEKMLSRIDAFQRMEEKHEFQDIERETNGAKVEQTVQGPKTLTDTNLPGPSRIAESDTDIDSPGYTVSSKGSSTKWIANKTYTEVDDTDIDNVNLVTEDDIDVPSKSHFDKHSGASVCGKRSVDKHDKQSDDVSGKNLFGKHSGLKVRFEGIDGEDDASKSEDNIFLKKILHAETGSVDDSDIGGKHHKSEPQIYGKSEDLNKTLKTEVIFFDEISDRDKCVHFGIPKKLSERTILDSVRKVQTSETSGTEFESTDLDAAIDQEKEKNENKMSSDVEESQEIDVDPHKDTDIDGEKKESQAENKLHVTVSVSNGSKSTEKVLGPEDFVYGKEALEHYKLYTQIEAKEERNRLQAEYERKMAEYDWKLTAIDEIIDLAKGFYVNPQSTKASKWRNLKRRVKLSSSHQIGRTEARRKLGELPDYRPYFTYFIILAQIISFIVVCVLGGITYVGLEPRLSVETDIRTFNGMETVHRWTLPNIWIGPSEADMIKYGAMYAPCMRPDIEIQFMFTQQNYSQHNTLGCCEIASRNVAGTTTEEECHMHTQGVGQWRSGVPCSERSGGELSVRHMLRPCCVGIKGQCQLLSHKHCMFLGGIFHQFGPEHCSQVNCLSKVCQFGGMEASKEQPWLPQAPYQWWRILLSLLYHHGILLVAFVVMAQFIVLRQIEHNAGWLRMIIIYVLSGTAALLASASFNPHHSHVGGVGAVCGMLGVLLVELLQFWSLVQKPWMEVAKLTVAIVLILFLGTLPYLEIMGMLAGLVTGALCGVIVLPYITFGRWGTHTRVVLIIVAVGLLFTEFSLLAHLFVNVQTLKSCGVCRLLNCVPYTDNMCNTELWE